MKIEAESQKQYLTKIIHKIPDPINISNNENVIYKNKAFIKIDLTYNSDEISLNESNNNQ